MQDFKKIILMAYERGIGMGGAGLETVAEFQPEVLKTYSIWLDTQK